MEGLSCQSLLERRFQQLCEEYEEQRLRFETSFSDEDALPRALVKAKVLLEEFRESLASMSGSSLADGVRRASLGRLLIAAQVEFDSLRFPDVGPETGWIELQEADIDGDGEEEVQLRSQLFDAVWDTSFGGALTHFEYKPRRVMLSASRLFPSEESAGVPGGAMIEYPLDASSLEEILKRVERPEAPKQPSAYSFSLLSRTPQILDLRLHSSAAGFRLFKDLHLKAGLGAHLQGSTTGFALEYSFSETPEAATFVSEWNLQFPSGQREAVSGFPLLCVGGVHEERLEASEYSWMSSEMFPGGCFGLRMIDGVNSFTVDIRSSRPVKGLWFGPPQKDVRESGILCLQLLIESQACLDPLRPFMLFASIV